MIIHGDCLEVLKSYPDNHFTSVITDPPYGLSFMDKKWDYDVPSIEIWQECLRVLKQGGTMLCFAGTRTQHRMAVNIEDAGWVIKDCLMYLYGTGFPKATDISKQLDKIAGAERKIINVIERTTHKEGTSYNWAGNKDTGICNYTIPTTDQVKLFNGYKSHGLKPAYEPIIMCMKPNDGTYANNAIKHGVAGINIDKSRISCNLDTEDLSRGRKCSKDIGIWGNVNQTKHLEANPQGRFPANIILDEESASMLDEQTGILKTGAMKPVLSSGKNDIYGKRKFSQPYQTYAANSGGASRFFYCAKASKAERNAGCEGLEAKSKPLMGEFKNNPGRETPKSSPTPRQNFHPTVKPLALMKYLINLIMPPKDGLILDPFAGSGTTILAAKQLGYNAIGIEREQEYCEIARARINNDKS